eukprot:scaffold17875_cov63-Attheya_sp.AAC.1
MICQTTVESLDQTAYSKTKGDERSDFLKNWINKVIMHLASDEHETFCALFCLTNPQVYGYLFRKPRLLTALPALVSWNGNVKTFSTFHAQFKGHLRMRSLSYLFDTTFRDYYLAKKLIHAITCQAGYDAKLTFDRLSQDSSFLYGAIQQAVASSPTVLLSINSTSNDGIGLYFGFIQKYEFGGSTTLTRTRLMAQANVAYTTNYPGGVRQFVDDKVTAFHTLKEMDSSLFTTDQSKITGLHDSFQQSTETWSYAQEIRGCTDYANKALDSLNNHITIEEHSNRHAAHFSQVHRVPNDVDYDDEANILLVNFRNVPAGLQLHQDLRNVLSRDTLRLIVQERNDHLEGPNTAEQSSYRYNRTPRDPRPPAVIGRQYEGNANATANEEEEDEESEEVTTLRNVLNTKEIDNLTGLLADYQGSIRQVRVSLDYYNINLSISSDNLYVTAINNGADTCVIGKGWHIIHYLVGANGKQRKANLVGYDPTSTRTNGLPMVSASCITQLNDEKIMLIVNQAVYNESQALTLLSEFQLKHNDWIVDMTHKKHKSYNSSGFGSQQMEKEDTVIPFQLRSCLMTFNIRAPTDQEVTDMTPIILTDENPWR